MRRKPQPEEPKRAAIRCAVYTRKSTEEGLEQEFNSLDAQREAGVLFVKSQQHEGWTCLPDRYDDGGFTGGNMDRPALKRLMEDIEAGKVDAVVVYKVDRLSRSLLDFARMMQTFEKYRVSFVSVTQQFNSATSMGRLVLNVLLSFAQKVRYKEEIHDGEHAAIVDPVIWQRVQALLERPPGRCPGSQQVRGLVQGDHPLRPL